MKVLAKIIVVLMVVGLTGQVFAKEIIKTVDGYKVSAEIGKKSVVIGDNIVKISIKDKNNKPVKDAKISIVGTMPAMPGMPPCNETGEVKLKGSKYEGKINLTMGGAWNIELKFVANGKTQKVNYSVDAR